MGRHARVHRCPHAAATTNQALVEHAAVFTQGIAGREEHLLLNPAGIPVVKPIAAARLPSRPLARRWSTCCLILRRAGFGVRELVQRIERGVIELLARYGIEAYGKREVPGCMCGRTGHRRLAIALGLKGYATAALTTASLNVAMDLAPFFRINPCGQRPGCHRSGHADCHAAGLRSGVAGAGWRCALAHGYQHLFAQTCLLLGKDANLRKVDFWLHRPLCPM